MCSLLIIKHVGYVGLSIVFSVISLHGILLAISLASQDSNLFISILLTATNSSENLSLTIREKEAGSSSMDVTGENLVQCTFPLTKRALETQHYWPWLSPCISSFSCTASHPLRSTCHSHCCCNKPLCTGATWQHLASAHFLPSAFSVCPPGGWPVFILPFWGTHNCTKKLTPQGAMLGQLVSGFGDTCSSFILWQMILHSFSEGPNWEWVPQLSVVLSSSVMNITLAVGILESPGWMGSFSLGFVLSSGFVVPPWIGCPSFDIPSVLLLFFEIISLNKILKCKSLFHHLLLKGNLG